jgi:hypothetical protein
MKRIILRDWESRAFRRGRLTQLRRLVNPQPFQDPKWGLSWAPKGIANNKPLYCERNVNWNPISNAFLDHGCPLGGAGSRLWVAEAYKFWCHSFASVGVEYVAGGDDKIVHFEDGWDMPSLEVQTRNGLDGSRLKRSPSTMPRWASRSIIELTAVRVERVQDVTEEEAKKCGLESFRETCQSIGDFDETMTLRDLYKVLHEYRYGQASWDRNDWVWVSDVRRVEK